jgi:hypothetical protein
LVALAADVKTLVEQCAAPDVPQPDLASENTVKTHLRRIYTKLAVDKCRDAVLRARLTGQLV